MTRCDIRVIHVDAALLVLDKPAGLLAVPGRGAEKLDCLASRAQAQFPDALVVHRLDMSTSGLMLMARGAAWQRTLSIAFAERRVGKRYRALVAGHITLAADTWAEIDLPLASDWPNRPKQQVDTVRGKASLTRYRVLGYDVHRQATLLDLEPITGRSHQLRVHLQAIGHPILGDALYAPPAVHALAPRLMLHATQLSLVHPLTFEPLHFRSDTAF